MPTNDNTSYRLKTVDFNPIVFAASAYKPISYTGPTLSEAGVAETNRNNEAYRMSVGVDESLSTARANLNYKDHAWLDEMAEESRKRIDAQMNLGNFESAIRIAREEGQKLARNEELQNRILANAHYQEQRKKIKNGNYDDLTKRYWDAHNDYEYNGVGYWEEKVSLANDIDIDGLIKTVINRTPTDSENVSTTDNVATTYMVNENGETVILEEPKQIGDTNTYTNLGDKYKKTAGSFTNNTHSSENYIEKSYDRLNRTFNDIIGTDNIRRSLMQKFNVNMWAIKDAKSKMDNASLSEEERNAARDTYNVLRQSWSDENGILFTSYEDWINKKVRKQLVNAAYTHTGMSTSNTKSGQLDSAYERNSIDGQNVADAEVLENTEDASVSGTSIARSYTLDPRTGNKLPYDDYIGSVVSMMKPQGTNTQQETK